MLEKRIDRLDAVEAVEIAIGACDGRKGLPEEISLCSHVRATAWLGLS